MKLGELSLGAAAVPVPRVVRHAHGGPEVRTSGQPSAEAREAEVLARCFPWHSGPVPLRKRSGRRASQHGRCCLPAASSGREVPLKQSGAGRRLKSAGGVGRHLYVVPLR